jgi:hypothetical protein
MFHPPRPPAIGPQQVATQLPQRHGNIARQIYAKLTEITHTLLLLLRELITDKFHTSKAGKYYFKLQL